MEKYREKIHCNGFEGLYRKYNGAKSMYHIAHFDRGRGQRMYLCGCGKSIRIGEGYIHPRTTKGSKRTKFQDRSKYNIKSRT